MLHKERCYSIITFSICKALTNKILAIIFSSIRFVIYLTTYILLKNWQKETKILESFFIFQFVFEIIILLTSVFMLIFSKNLNRKWIYRFFRILTIIITVYLFFNFFIDVCIFAGIKYKEFPDLYCLEKDPIFNYTDDKFAESTYSLEKFINKDTQKINISLINDTLFNFTYLIKKDNQLYVPDLKNFQISFNEGIKSNLKPYQKRHRSEFNKEMILQLINIIFDILSFFLWNSIRYKHKKLIQNGVIKKYGRKVIYTGYVEIIFKIILIVKVKIIKEEQALFEVRNNENYIADIDIKNCSIFWTSIMALFSLFGSLIAFIVLIIQRNKENLITKALHFPFTLTYFGDGLYLYLLIFLIVFFGIDLFIVNSARMFTNHHEHMNNPFKQCIGSILLFTIGLVNLFFSICGILGALFFIVGDLDSNGNLYIKTACIDSDISCYGLFQFPSSFPLDNKKYSTIFYYIYIKKISKSDQGKHIAKLIIILFIYFCEFYIILFDEFLHFNFDKIRFGKCLVHDYIIADNFEFYLIDDISAQIDNNEQYYKNSINDSYFITYNNNNVKKPIDANERKKEQIIIKVDNTQAQTSKGISQTNINSTVIRISNNLKTNK